MLSLVLASRNRKKAVEFAELLQPHGIVLESVADFPAAPQVIESGITFAENAALKAVETARALGRWTLADDSGITVDTSRRPKNNPSLFLVCGIILPSSFRSVNQHVIYKAEIPTSHCKRLKCLSARFCKPEKFMKKNR